MTFGRETRFRKKLLAPARLRPGENVLDVGCGTGTLALHAKRAIGDGGTVAGIDPAFEMIARARHKARRARLAINFQTGTGEALPFHDASFDVVLCTVALHHTKRATREAAVREMARTLRPGGRLILIDFVFGKHSRSVAGWLHHRHGLGAGDLRELATSAGMRASEEGPVGMWDLNYVVATR